MGTNYYRRGFRDTDPEIHIGKTSAAGRYCFACRLTFCLAGEEYIHDHKSMWAESCPKCGGEGGHATSFTWAMNPNLWRENIQLHHECPTCHREYDDKENEIEDEYGRLHTAEHFAKFIKDCPIQYTHMVGQHFQ